MVPERQATLEAESGLTEIVCNTAMNGLRCPKCSARGQLAIEVTPPTLQLRCTRCDYQGVAEVYVRGR